MRKSGSKHPSTGDGPGVIAPDGCAVDLYSLLLPGREPAVIHAAASQGASILDLGAGTGRLTHPLIDLGHDVVAVDESAEMLANIRGARTVCSRIEDLRLERAFDVVLLASHLVNVADEDVRHRLLAACRRHVRADGVVLIERLTREWADTVESTAGEVGGVATELRILDRQHPGLVTATIDYRVGASHWTHTFTARGLDDHEMEHDLDRAGLRLDRKMTDEGQWMAATRA